MSGPENDAGPVGPAPLSAFAQRLTNRHYVYWCFVCRSVLRLETAEHAERVAVVEGGEVEVFREPNDEPSCPCCLSHMYAHEKLVEYGQTPVGSGDWDAFAAWYAREFLAGEYVAPFSVRR